MMVKFACFLVLFVNSFWLNGGQTTGGDTTGGFYDYTTGGGGDTRGGSYTTGGTAGGDTTGGLPEPEPTAIKVSSDNAVIAGYFDFYVGLNDIYTNNQLISGLANETKLIGIWTINETYNNCTNGTLSIDLLNRWYEFDIYINNIYLGTCTESVADQTLEYVSCFNDDSDATIMIDDYISSGDGILNITIEITKDSSDVYMWRCDVGDTWEGCFTQTKIIRDYTFVMKNTIECYDPTINENVIADTGTGNGNGNNGNGNGKPSTATTLAPSDKVHHAEFVISPDVFFNELSWTLVNESNVTVWSEESNNYGGTSKMTSSTWIRDGCYTFSIYDGGDDGLAELVYGSSYEGWFTFSVNNHTLTFGAQSFENSTFELYFCTNNTFLSGHNNHNLTLLVSGCYDTMQDFEITVSDASSDIVYYSNHYFANDDYQSEMSETLQLFVENNCYKVTIDKSYLCFYQVLMDSNETSQCIGTSAYEENVDQDVSTIICPSNGINSDLVSPYCENSNYFINLPNKGYYSGLTSFGCKDGPCMISKKFNLNGECLNPSISVKMVNTGAPTWMDTFYYKAYVNSYELFDCASIGDTTQTSIGEVGNCYATRYNSSFNSISLSSYFEIEKTFVVTLAVEYTLIPQPYNDEYDLFGGVYISCNETNRQGDECNNIVTLSFQYDDDPLSVDWQITNSSGDVILWDNLDGFHSNYESVTFSSSEIGSCLFDATNECFTLSITDSDNNGIWPNGLFWLSVYDNSNNNSNNNNNNGSLYDVTLDVQTFATDGGYIEFCIDEIIRGANNLTIEFDYDTAISIIEMENDVTIYDNSFNIYNYYDDSAIAADNGQWTIWVNDGCYEITVYDIGDETKDLAHGFYQIWINGDLVSLGGYYQRYETSIICSDVNHMSHYMYNSQDAAREDSSLIFVTSTEYVSSTEEEFLAKSVSSLYSSKLKKSGGKDALVADSLSCLGSASCDEMFNLTIDTYIEAAFGLICSSVLPIKFSISYVDDEPRNWYYNIDESSNMNYFVDTHVECDGTKSCYIPVAGDLVGYGTSSMYNPYGINITAIGSMVISNTTISLVTSVELYQELDVLWYEYDPYALNIDGYYSLFDVQLYCSNINTYAFLTCRINCVSDAPQYFSHFSSYCADICDVSTNCNFIYNTSDMDNTSYAMMIQLNSIIDDVEASYESDCYTEEGYGIVFETGYSLNAEEDIINNEIESPICCLGYQSCKLTLSVTTNLGNIYCFGSESCAEASLLWTGDSQTNNDGGQSIYCMGTYSCSESLIQAGNNIVCSTQQACENSFILEASSLYCTMQACSSTFIRKVSNVYIIDEQSDIVIYSGYIGEMNVYLRGYNAGYDVTIYCNDGDVCNIDCGYKSCKYESTLLHCYGKCFFKCRQDWNGSVSEYSNCLSVVTSLAPSAAPSAVPSNAPSIAPSSAPTRLPTAVPTNAPSVIPSNAPSFSPTVAPTDIPTQVPTDIPSMTPSAAPTMFPTFMPTDYQLLTEEELSSYFNWVIGILILIVILMLLIGCFDAKRKHNESQFEWMAIVGFAIYAIDFFSDIFFCGKLYTLWIDERLEYTFYYFILFLTSIVFLVVPMISNIGQLHNEVSKWTKDPILINTEIPLWIASNMKFVYILALLCGSSFSAISLCNSQFLEWPIFSMNLSKYHRKLFQTRRFFSIVLFENIPQLMIQCATLYLVIDENNEEGTLLITIFSMLFTVFSILSCVLEYYTTSTIIKSRNLVLIDMHVDSQAVGQFKGNQFRHNVLHKRRDIIHLMKRIISVTARQVDLLKPQQDANGVSLTFIIQIDEIQFEKIKTKFHNAIANNGFDKEFSNIFGFGNTSTSLASTSAVNVPASDVKIEMFAMNNEARNNKCLQLCHRIRFGFGNNNNNNSGYGINKMKSIEMSSEDLPPNGARLKSVYSEMSLGSPKSTSQSGPPLTGQTHDGFTLGSDNGGDTGGDANVPPAVPNFGSIKIGIDKNASELANDKAFARVASRTATPRAYESESESDGAEIPTGNGHAGKVGVAIPDKPTVETTLEWIEQRLNRDIEFSEGMGFNEIEMFLNEWKEKNVTFQDLLNMKKDNKKFNQFKNGFDNQSFDIWHCVKNSIAKFKHTDAKNAVFVE